MAAAGDRRVGGHGAPRTRYRAGLGERPRRRGHSRRGGARRRPVRSHRAGTAWWTPGRRVAVASPNAAPLARALSHAALAGASRFLARAGPRPDALFLAAGLLEIGGGYL